MQTFLPYADFQISAKVLDYRRLGKQRVEAFHIYKCLTDTPTNAGKAYKGWRNHPAVLMWSGYENALLLYMNETITEWGRRGFNNVKMKIAEIDGDVVYPPWFGYEPLHSSHRSNLLRKDFSHYYKFGWDEPSDLPYVWGNNLAI